MAELTFNSPGVSTREIDLTGPANAGPTGIPAGVIGTTNLGPAFVPVTVGNVQDFNAVFGPSDGEKFGPLAAYEWLRNAQSLTFLRVLGVGDGNPRAADGSVTRGGFTVGEEQVQATGLVAGNPNAVSGGEQGRLYFLGCYVSQSANSTVLTDAGLAEEAQPVIRGTILAASGVIPQLRAAGAVAVPTNIAAVEGGTLAGSYSGSVDITNGESSFVMFLNGQSHATDTTSYPNYVSASFDPQSSNYFAKVFNKDPDLLEDSGYVLYTHYDLYTSMATITGSNLTGSNHVEVNTRTFEDIGFILPGQAGRNTGTTTQPNYESFKDRFRAPFSPFVISQKFGSDNVDLFKVEALTDGTTSHPEKPLAQKGANNRFKISIQNVTKPVSTAEPYGTFDLVVRDFYDTDDDPIVLEEFRGLSLNRSSERYVARVIGDQKVFYDFDKPSDDQKLVVQGTYPNNSAYIRVSVSTDLDNGNVDSSALPVGFRGPYHLVTSGSAMLYTGSVGIRDTDPHGNDAFAETLRRAVELPIPMRESLLIGSGSNARSNKRLHWGAQFERKTDPAQPNLSRITDPTMESYTKYFPMFGLTTLNPWVGANAGTGSVGSSTLDSDVFNYNKFSLENIQVVTGSDGKVDVTTVNSWTYVRNGTIAANEGNKTRALSVDTDFSVGSLKELNKFTFFVQGGFDGSNIFDPEKSKFSDLAVRREMGDVTNQGGKNGPTVKSYLKGLQVMGETTDVDIQLLTIPGIRHTTVTNQAITTVEDRFDAMYIMDIEELDNANTVITSSIQNPDVQLTSTNFSNRGLDSSFAAAYFPDVRMTDPETNTVVQAPPSVAVLGAFAQNDVLGHPWFAPAGFNRGGLPTVIEPDVRLSRANMDRLYEADINPIVSFPGSSGPVIWGQKTLQAKQSSLDRVNVRRLMIALRRQVRQVANTILFEPGRQETLDKFSSLVEPILARIQEQQGVDSYKILIDSSTTTQADIENNTIRGKIFVQPTRVAEFISLDFVVTNAGAEIS